MEQFYTVRITEPIVFRSNAKYGIVSGKVVLKPKDKKERIISYDQIEKGIVTLTVDGASFNIDLEK
jgi:hypothetical protein